MSKPQYKILRNQPEEESYGQYVYSYDLETFWEETGISTPFKEDDLYSIITKQRNSTSYETGDSSDDIYYPNESVWGSLQAQLFNEASHIFSNWRPISNIFVGNSLDYQGGTYLQKYYDFNDSEYYKTTSPNVVNLYFDLCKNDYTFDVDLKSQWELLAEWYNSLGASVDAEYLKGINEYSGNYSLIAQPMKIKILNWDWKEGDLDWDSYSVASAGEITEDLYNIDYETPNVLSHQYNEPGVKTIKAIVYSEMKNNKYKFVHYKNIEIKFNLGLDNIYFDDFTVLGGSDFTALPWPETSPIIGGISRESDYFKSLDKIISLNKFSDDEKYDKYNLIRALENDQLGSSLGDCDIQQVRLNKFSFDMNYLLGISSRVTTNGHDFYKYDNFDYWNGNEEIDSFSKETSIGDIFIDESLDTDLKSNTLFEINMIDLDEDLNVLYDTSGNGIVSILIGDYKIQKPSIDVKSSRDSVIKVPVIKNKPENGAL